MGRFNRVVAVDVPHHVTQRGNGRRFILDCDADRAVYLKLLHENLDLYGVALIGYCLMSNHVHLIATPKKAEGLGEALKQIHGRYACYWNIAHPRKRARVARTILFLPSRPDAPLESIALHRAESVAGSFGLRARVLALVERRHPLRLPPARCVLGSRCVATPLDRHNLARVLRRRGNRIQASRHSSTNTHRAPTGDGRLYSRS
jgi:REP element-mobilizing transposase RayT